MELAKPVMGTIEPAPRAAEFVEDAEAGEEGREEDEHSRRGRTSLLFRQAEGSEVVLDDLAERAD
jgi:hypothetical protein